MVVNIIYNSKALYVAHDATMIFQDSRLDGTFLEPNYLGSFSVRLKDAF